MRKATTSTRRPTMKQPRPVPITHFSRSATLAQGKMTQVEYTYTGMFAGKEPCKSALTKPSCPTKTRRNTVEQEKKRREMTGVEVSQITGFYISGSLVWVRNASLLPCIAKSHSRLFQASYIHLSV
jgi:hypothetical protein